MSYIYFRPPVHPLSAASCAWILPTVFTSFSHVQHPPPGMTLYILALQTSILGLESRWGGGGCLSGDQSPFLRPLHALYMGVCMAVYYLYTVGTYNVRCNNTKLRIGTRYRVRCLKFWGSCHDRRVALGLYIAITVPIPFPRIPIGTTIFSPPCSCDAHRFTPHAPFSP